MVGRGLVGGAVVGGYGVLGAMVVGRAVVAQKDSHSHSLIKGSGDNGD